MSRPLATLILLFISATSSLVAGGQDLPRDFTNTTPESLGIRPVKPQKDSASSFIIGAKNVTDSLRELTALAGQSIRKLEKRMRPGADSRLGFLGKDESLLEVLEADNRFVVDEMGLSHQELAKHLHVIGAIAVKHAIGKPLDIRYHGKTFRIEATCFRGIQDSPFDDETKTNCNATVQNLGSNKKLGFSLLVPHMIERYGFYEGKGTPYRVDPRVILEVLDFIKPKKGGVP